MTVRTNDPNYRGDTGEQVDVVPGVPTDRVRWGPIMAGTFAALTALAVLSSLGAAIGLSAYDRSDDARRFSVGAGSWGVISMLVAFGFGGWLAARSSAVRGRDNGLLNGFMVAGVGIPILLLALGSAGLLMSHAEIANDRDVAMRGQFDGAAQQASDGNAKASDNNQTPQQGTREEEARQGGSRAAWGTLLSRVLAIGAASMAGLIGARDDHHRDAGSQRRPTRADTGLAV